MTRWTRDAVSVLRTEEHFDRCRFTSRAARIVPLCAAWLLAVGIISACSSSEGTVTPPVVVVPPVDTTKPAPAPPVALALTAAPADTTTGFGVVNGTSLPTIAVALRDSLNRAVSRAGVAVSVAFLDAAGAVIPGAVLAGTTSSVTDTAGVARFTSIAPTSRVGLARLVFTATGLRPTSLSLRVTPGAPSATLSSFTVSADSVTSGGTVLASSVPIDASGNKLGPGRTVVFSTQGGTSAGTWGPVTFSTSDSSYRSTFAATVAGTSTSASATVDGVALATRRSLTVRPIPTVPDFTFTVNATSTFPISRYIYGANFVDDIASYGNATPPAELTLNRMGGNRLSAWNWETGFSNAGDDYFFQNDRFLQPTSTAPGDAVRSRAQSSFARGQAFMATIPMLGYVAGDACNCNVGTSDATRAQRLATHFKVSQAFKGAPLLTTPNSTDGFVYQDEFVNWFESAFPGRSTHLTAPVFFSLDNEPDIWNSTHRQIQSNLNDNPATPRLITYKGYTDTSIAYARAVKSVLPNALTFGPAVATYAGVAAAGRFPTPDPDFGSANFFDVYLDRMRAAQTTYGRRLLDVLDLHWYPAASAGAYEITNDYAPQDSAQIEARIQAPRSLWDPTYTERSWVVDVTAGPVRLIPRLRDQIAARYPGTKISISEYYYGRGGDISGGIAQADVLGVFGREGVFAAALWPQAGLFADPYGGDGTKAYAFVFGAFRMFLNYDGAGGRFGDTGLTATTSDVSASSVYASRDAQGRIVIVAINKTRAAKRISLALNGANTITRATAFALTSASPSPVRQPDSAVTITSTVGYVMPALSVSTLVLTP